MADDPTIQWALANPYGILVDQNADAWHSGHVNDILELPSGTLLVGTEKGGVWTVTTSGATVPLSDTWTNPDVNCLVAGPDDPDKHFFAGCTGGVIRETDLSASLPLLTWLPVSPPLPLLAGDVHRLVIIRGLRRIVAACSGGLFWSTIPSTSSSPGCRFPWGGKPARPPYQWKQATVDGVPGSPPQGFWDVAIGAAREGIARSELEDRRVITVVAGGFKAGAIFVGSWDSAENLVLRRAKASLIGGADETALLQALGTTSVSSCEVRPTVLYAACAASDGRLQEVLRSADGGRNWTFCEAKLADVPNPPIIQFKAGDQGTAWNNCIAASPTNTGMAALGWVGGPFLTLDSGKSWKQMTERTHLHSDIHSLRFEPTAASNDHRLYVGSDGGVARVDLDDYLAGTGQPYQSNFNRLLPTHQCYATPMPASSA